MSAQAFAASLGPGVNIMAANIRHDVLDEHDFIGLGHRIGHGGTVTCSRGLINWSACPGTSWRPPANAGDDEAIDLARERIVSDPGYVRAARRVLRAGLKLVLNPLHWKFMLQIDQRTLQLFWGAMLREFNTTDFPVDRVAFEMANELVIGTAGRLKIAQWTCCRALPRRCGRAARACAHTAGG